MIVEYVRHGVTGQYKGVVVAYPYDDMHYCIGWSVCNPLDKFDKKIALSIAVGRAQKWMTQFNRDHYNRKVKTRVKKVLARCDKYYKGLRRPEFLDEIL